LVWLQPALPWISMIDFNLGFVYNVGRREYIEVGRLSQNLGISNMELLRILLLDWWTKKVVIFCYRALNFVSYLSVSHVSSCGTKLASHLKVFHIYTEICVHAHRHTYIFWTVPCLFSVLPSYHLLPTYRLFFFLPLTQ
jgi:hypothetical protein